MKRVWLSITVLAVLATVVTACGKKASDSASEEMVESAMRAQGQEAEVTMDSETMQIKTDDGDMSIGEGTKLPDQWPDDVPVYKGLKLLTAMKMKEGFSIQGTTADSQEKVTAFYKEQATKGGWTEDMVMTQPQMAMLNYSKDNRSLAVVVTAAESETSVSVSITNK